jgi:hypothetical protein
MALAPCLGLRGTADRLIAGGGNAEDCRSGPTNPNHQRPIQESRSTESIIEHRGEPARMTKQPVLKEAFGVFSHEVQCTNPEHRHTTNPPGPCLGRTILIHKVGKALGGLAVVTLAGPPAADFGTASPCGGRSYGGPAECVRAGIPGDFLARRAIQISLLLDRGCRGNWPATLTAISSSCSPRRTWHVSAASLVAPSTGRLREASCGRRDSVIGSGSNPTSWSAGSGSGLSRLTHRRDPGVRSLPEARRAAAYGLCSTRWATDRRTR